MFATLAAAVGVCAALAAAAAAPPRPALAPAAPIWTVDKAASRLTFRGAAAGQTFDGVFKKWDAQIAFDAKNLRASHAAVTVDLASVVTGDPTRDQMLPTPDWFSIARFPKATFVTTAITQTGPDRFQAVGELKIRGVGRRVVMPFTLTIARDVATMAGTAVVDRTQFGVGQGQFASTDTVAAPVSVSVRLTAKTAR
jgi:polyisoprenoid-binding protein YceI